MNIISLTALSFGMSMDAFASAIAKGATERKANFIKALRVGLLFGVMLFAIGSGILYSHLTAV